jgi:chromosome segregation ATPase
VSLQTQLASAKTTLEHLRKSKAKLEQQVREYAARVERTPELEPAYQTLLRDRDNTAQKFQEYRSRLLEAQVAEGLELERKGERFSLVEPPILPESPISPNRKAILFLGLVLAMAGGIGSGALAEALDGSIHSAERLREVMKIAPLSVIPYYATAEEKRARGKRNQLIGVGAMIMTVALFGVVHLFVIPLDVVWYVALRKMRLE